MTNPANFGSDNTSGVSPEIMAALETANQGSASAYGADPWTGRLQDRFAEIFGTDVAVFPVATGSAANVLGLSMLTPRHGAIYCHAEAHIQEDECGAPEFYTGAKLMPLEGPHAKLEPEVLAAALALTGSRPPHQVEPAALSISQASELGACYRPAEIAALSELVRSYGMALHMDGARLANALAFLDCSPADATWRAGVDVLSFGATKNGAMAAEAVVFFRPELADAFPYRRKQGGHLFSKMRFLSAQLEAYLNDDLWLRNARHANAAAQQLSAGLLAVPGAELAHPVEANEIFMALPEAVVAGLEAEGQNFHRWPGGSPDQPLIRLVTAFNTTDQSVGDFIAAAARQAAA
ncbi:MAG: beta-eliminating lyase-related protein [Alphaproteobacteria bacterium]|jgi:threonine aldolase|nr:low specificity L-threonine aldolase [Rhodospirillaceae bacterium]MDP6407064.1 beta-eliminating lyase-related protein [Alphaproteobacteria bacterium]MDP6623517.1 beta-eliminating lyase-related protein [Alphaproteobacteria bacterium]